jgi:ribonuclease P protein component
MDRSLRLREDWEVRNARSRGRAVAQGPLVVRILARADPGLSNRYAVVAGKQAGGAVQRNRCKRLVRESLRHLHPRLKQSHDIVVIIRGGTDELTGYAVANDILTAIFTRAGLLPAATESVSSVASTDER